MVRSLLTLAYTVYLSFSHLDSWAASVEKQCSKHNVKFNTADSTNGLLGSYYNGTIQSFCQFHTEASNYCVCCVKCTVWYPSFPFFSQVKYAAPKDTVFMFMFYQPIRYQWRETDFFPCSVKCGGGKTQTRAPGTSIWSILAFFHFQVAQQALNRLSRFFILLYPSNNQRMKDFTPCWLTNVKTLYLICWKW